MGIIERFWSNSGYNGFVFAFSPSGPLNIRQISMDIHSAKSGLNIREMYPIRIYVCQPLRAAEAAQGTVAARDGRAEEVARGTAPLVAVPARFFPRSVFFYRLDSGSSSESVPGLEHAFPPSFSDTLHASRAGCGLALGVGAFLYECSRYV